MMNRNKSLLRAVGIVILVAGFMLILSCSAQQATSPLSAISAQQKPRTTNQPIDFKPVWEKFCEESPIEVTVYWWNVEGISDSGQSNWNLDVGQTTALLGCITNIVNDYSTNRGVIFKDEEPDSDILPPECLPEGMIDIKNSNGVLCEISYYGISRLKEDPSFGIVITDNGNRSGFTIPCSREFIEHIYNELKKIKEKRQ